MAGLIFDQGEVILLDLLTNHGTYSPENLVLKLFKNDLTPGDDCTESSFTEADFEGYVPITLTGASWTLTANAPSTGTFSVQTFSSTSDQTLQYIYGYWVEQATSEKAIGGERFSDGPYGILLDGDFVEVTPTLSMKKAGE